VFILSDRNIDAEYAEMRRSLGQFVYRFALGNVRDVNALGDEVSKA